MVARAQVRVPSLREDLDYRRVYHTAACMTPASGAPMEEWEEGRAGTCMDLEAPGCRVAVLVLVGLSEGHLAVLVLGPEGTAPLKEEE